MRKVRIKPGRAKPNLARVVLLSAIIGAIIIGAATRFRPRQGDSLRDHAASAVGTLSFNKDIAPIVFKHCAGCHRPGQSAPFSLLTYHDVRKHARQIVDVTRRRYMPPWLPEPGYGGLANERRLTANELGILEQWAAEGAFEGAASDLPPAPRWSEGWHLGQPDLVVSMTEPYALAAEGKDVYRNFVIPVPISKPRYVRAVELQPGNPRIVHHAFLKVDRTRQSRRLDREDGEPGFPGMTLPESVQMPEGHFLAWQPGKIPSEEPEGLSWALENGSDLVLQLHLRPSGKPEVIQSRVGLYFTEKPPANTSFKLCLTAYTIDIPAGAKDYLVADNYVLPVDVEALAVLPHAHYLCREMQGFATLPDGTRKWLIWIKDWDFNWQGDYRYAGPVFLPKGTTLSMRFTYDNSTNNLRNPNHPPKPVSYGPESNDEMAELWFQLLVRNRNDLAVVMDDYQAKLRRLFIEGDEYRLQRDPNDSRAHANLGLALLSLSRYEEALRHLRAAIQIDPRRQDAHYYLGLLFRQQKKFADARSEFENVLQLNPGH